MYAKARVRETKKPLFYESFSTLQWWSSNWKRMPELYKLVTKALSLRPSSTPAERNWSSFGYIHSLSRNRLTAERVIDMVFVLENLRIQEPAEHNFKGLGDFMTFTQDDDNVDLRHEW
jgi:hypothetical protein